MKVNGKHYRTIWVKEDDNSVIQVIDQRNLPHEFVIEDLKTVDDFRTAIIDMHIRGAGLIGAAAGYAMYISTLSNTGNIDHIKRDAECLIATRPTAANLKWAVDRQLKAIQKESADSGKIETALRTANEIADEDVHFCQKIGEHGLSIIEDIYAKKSGGMVNILTHCNAGWLAFVDFGSATSPIYAAFDKGVKIHVWIDETRPRNQGARLTAWEFNEHGIPHTVIPDNTGGHLMQHGMVDLILVGTDRTTYTGFAANKIGTYLKALSAKANNVPFYVAVPSSSIDWKIKDGIRDIPIENREQDEVKYIQGLGSKGIEKVLLTPQDSKAANYAFDVTPPGLITGLITERGICNPDKDSIFRLYPEKKKRS